ncbi:MAG: glycosyltransferase family 2 protein, partial [Patescibacteria group bacterium]
MDLSIIIVNWKVRDLLRRCLLSVYAGTSGISFEVFVADNDSDDGSVEMVRREFPQAALLANKKNLGFAAGNNPAIKMSKGDFVVWLNPDAEVIGNALGRMVGYLRANPEVGIAGPRIVNEDGSVQPSVRRFPTPLSQALIMLKIQNLMPTLAPLRRYYALDFDYSRAVAVDQVMGAAMFIRRSVFEKIGLLDERFFIWYEEVDFCKRAKDAGFEIRYVPAATVRHGGGQSFRQVFGPKKQRMMNRSLRQYMGKHYGWPAAAAMAALHPLS